MSSETRRIFVRGLNGRLKGVEVRTRRVPNDPKRKVRGLPPWMMREIADGKRRPLP